MGRFLSGLSWSQPVASTAHALGMGLGDVQALVGSRAVGAGAAVGSIPQDVHDLIRRAERARLIVTQASTNHYKIWQDQEGLGSPVVIPSTGSDSYRGLRSITEIRNRFGIDLREY